MGSTLAESARRYIAPRNLQVHNNSMKFTHREYGDCSQRNSLGFN